MIKRLKPHADYKSSECPWLGTVPVHWTEKRAKYFYREVDERSTTGKEELLSVSHKTGVTLRPKHVTMFKAESNIGHKICRPGDLVINTMWAFMAALGVSRQKGIVSPSYGVYSPITHSDLNPEYADRLLRTEAYKSEYLCRSTGIRSSRLRLYPDEFLRIPILCPPAEEQAAIVRFLDHVDRKIRRYIRAKRRLIGLLNEQKQAIIHRAVTRGLDPNVRLKPSGVEWLGDVPEGWEVQRLKTILTGIDQGISPQAETRQADNGSWGVLKSGCVNYGFFRDDEHKRLPEGFAVDEQLAVKVGDVLVSRACGSPKLVGSVGRVSQLRFKLILSDKTFRLNFKIPELSNFAVAAMNSRYFRWQVEQAISGAEGLAKNLPLSALKNFLLVLPPVQKATEVAGNLHRQTQLITTSLLSLEHETQLLLEYRIRLIADVVTGKLDVREAASKLPAELDEEPLEDDLLESEDAQDDTEAEFEAQEVEA